MTRLLRKLQIKVSEIAYGHLDSTIVVLGIFIAAILFWLATGNSQGILSDYLVNLSAGVVTVVLTVLLVDKLRQWHLKRELQEPTKQAVFRIKNSHNLLILLLSIMNYKAKSAFRADILDENKNKFFDESTHNKEVVRLAKEGKALIVSQNQNTLRSVKQCVESIEKELLKVRENYDFATNNTFKTELATFINKIDSVKGMWIFREIDTSTLASFTDADADTFLKIAMQEYLSVYSVFASKYKAQ